MTLGLKTRLTDKELSYLEACPRRGNLLFEGIKETSVGEDSHEERQFARLCPPS